MSAALPVHHDGTWVLAYIGLGANLGDARGTLEAAVRMCASLPESRLVARSAFYRTAPVDADGDDYMNAVVALATCLDPYKLLQKFHEIECLHGRRRPFRHSPRTLDLDLLLYGDQIISTPELVVPHPRMHRRAFVLRPLADIAPEIQVPGRGAVAELLAGVAGQRIDKLAT